MCVCVCVVCHCVCVCVHNNTSSLASMVTFTRKQSVHYQCLVMFTCALTWKSGDINFNANLVLSVQCLVNHIAYSNGLIVDR